MAYTDALSNWEVKGYVQFQLTETCYEWIRKQLGIDLTNLAASLQEYVAGGGEIDEVIERREQWSAKYPFHYDLRLSINGKRVYVETRLRYKLPIRPDESSIVVVNVHAP